jgi:hypothetical protein
MSSKTKRKYTFDDSDESSEELIIPRTSKKTKDSEQTKKEELPKVKRNIFEEDVDSRKKATSIAHSDDEEEEFISSSKKIDSEDQEEFSKPQRKNRNTSSAHYSDDEEPSRPQRKNENSKKISKTSDEDFSAPHRKGQKSKNFQSLSDDEESPPQRKSSSDSHRKTVIIDDDDEESPHKTTFSHDDDEDQDSRKSVRYAVDAPGFSGVNVKIYFKDDEEIYEDTSTGAKYVKHGDGDDLYYVNTKTGAVVEPKSRKNEVDMLDEKINGAFSISIHSGSAFKDLISGNKIESATFHIAVSSIGVEFYIKHVPLSLDGDGDEFAKKVKSKKKKNSRQGSLFSKINANDFHTLWSFDGKGKIDYIISMWVNVEAFYKKISSATKDSVIHIVKHKCDSKVHISLTTNGALTTSGVLNFTIESTLPDIPDSYFDMSTRSATQIITPSPSFSVAYTNVNKQKVNENSDMYMYFFKEGFIVMLFRNNKGEIDQFSPVASNVTSLDSKKVDELISKISDKDRSKYCIEHILVSDIAKNFNKVAKRANGTISWYVNQAFLKYHIIANELELSTYIER